MDNTLKKKVIDAIEKLPEDKIAEVIDFIEYLKLKEEKEKMYEEDRDWLDADLADLPDYDWGTNGLPKGKPVKYIPGIGLIVEGGK
ncbi:hypothetical protein TKV_c14580 [Thermoanaerobacter kivui]|uniref:DUF2281 domain-containing protein n=1 Tax=Thermoanaerobacter kivui TaxID=2325 RepID=A0A097AS47_THEKI|nr:DUF2281 domain-containing protein [Thermoanaerobacter kivui]AIS52627.1 hypothetical protein TKV_c14580 [Thermoanaerobacter kivui]